LSNPGCSGKPRAKHKKRRKGQRKPGPSNLAILNRLLPRKIRAAFNGEEREITALEAIIQQLILKEAARDGRASRILLKYEELTRHGTEVPLQITFVDSDYTHALADEAPEPSDG
jgi:hypothetical protein